MLWMACCVRVVVVQNDATQHLATNRDAAQSEVADGQMMVGGMDEMRWMNGGMGETGRILGWDGLDWIGLDWMD